MPHYLHTLDEFFTHIEKKGFFDLYFLNPKLSLYDAGYCVFFFCLLIWLRLLIVGIRKKGKTQNHSIINKICRNPLLNQINKKYKITTPATLYKWKENVWFFLWHTFSFFYNFTALLSMHGVFSNKTGWVKMCLNDRTGRWLFLVTPEEYSENKKGWPYMYTVDSIYYFYILQISYWSSCLLFLNFEVKRRDYYVFVLHHVSTIILLSFSHVLNFWRVGLIILLVHDVVDMFLYASKSLNYCLFKKNVLLSICYALFVLSYFYFRIYLYFFYLVLPLSNTKLIREYTDGFVNSHYDVPGGVVLIVLLWVLMIMHIYWFLLIIKMTYVFIMKMGNFGVSSKKTENEPIQDIRSDDEEDAENFEDEDEDQDQDPSSHPKED